MSKIETPSSRLFRSSTILPSSIRLYMLLNYIHVAAAVVVSVVAGNFLFEKKIYNFLFVSFIKAFFLSFQSF